MNLRQCMFLLETRLRAPRRPFDHQINRGVDELMTFVA
jgi:hypothetical protein